MNLIGHLACAGDAPAAVQAGALLPDLLSLYRRKARSAFLVSYWSQHHKALPGAEAVMAGIHFHQHVDRLFHHAPVFLEIADALQAALKNASTTPGLKRFLPAHVLSELYLDHLLLREEPVWEHRFYRALEGKGRMVLVPFAEAHPLVQKRTFSAFLDRMVAVRFVADYRDATGILDRMNRVLVRFGQRMLESAEREAVLQIFAQREQVSRAQLWMFMETARASYSSFASWEQPVANARSPFSEAAAANG
jgi:hypothetical protein